MGSALKEMLNANSQSLVGVTKKWKSQFKMFALGRDGCLQSLFNKELSNVRRQDLAVAFIPNGTI